MSLAAYHLECKRLWLAAWRDKYPGAVCTLTRKEVACDHAEGLSPAECVMNWLAGRKVCGDTSVGDAARGLAESREMYR